MYLYSSSSSPVGGSGHRIISMASLIIAAVLLVMVKRLLESIEIESISDVIVIYFAEELMVLQADEPVNPTFALIGAVGRAL